MRYKIVFFLVVFFKVQTSLSQEQDIAHLKDTIIAGRLLDIDRIKVNSNSNHAGIIFYYGVHHIKIERLDLRNKSIIDTLVLAFVYNINTETEKYRKDFGLTIGEVYAFHVSSFKPCKSDFPRIQGKCDLYNLNFQPTSNKLIKKYTDILRIILFYKYPY